MLIYLPVAGMSADVFLLLAMGGGAGFLSGLLGIGGGFLISPFLIFYGIPPAVAVASQANQMIAASLSGFIAHWNQKRVDLKLGLFLSLGSFFGAAIGIAFFDFLRRKGQIDFFIPAGYVLFLGSVALLMFVQTTRAMLRRKPEETALKVPSWVEKLPFKMRFETSNVEISVIPPLVISMFVGILVAMMGIGGGFFFIPAMFYLMGIPSKLIPGTALLQTVLITTAVTAMQATTQYTVDIVLAFVLLVGGVFGAQIGSRVGRKISGPWLRIALTVLMISVCVKLALMLMLEPETRFVVER
jgi:uncharacterized membrane protein YfcA